MDKVKKLLEAYVEWIAVLLGAAFLMWMVYSYVYQQPVTVAVGPTPAVAPGAIDNQIWDSQGKTLQAQMDNRSAVKVDVPPVADGVAKSLDAQSPDTVALANAWTVSEIGPDIDAGGTRQGGVSPTVAQGKVTRLPEAPKMYKLAVSAGHSNLLPVADTSTGGAAAAAPAGQPAAAGNPVGANAQAMDRSWVSVSAMLPATSGLNAAFTAAKIPANPAIHKTTVLRVILWRSERDATGNWGPEVMVQPPGIDALPPVPPQEAVQRADVVAQENYRRFAELNAPLILRPAFYQWVEGDKWFVPGTPNPNASAVELVEDKFDAAHFTGDLDTLDDADRKAVMDARRAASLAAAAAARQQQAAASAAAQAAARAAAQQRGSSGSSGGRSGGRSGGGGGRSGGGGGGGGGGGNGGFLVADPGRAAAASGLVQDDGRDRGDVPPPGMPGVPPMQPQDQGGTPTPAPGAPDLGPDIPKGAFDPATQPDFLVWAHDDTVVPGKTYRYRLQYVIVSPVFATQQLCNPQGLASQFSITGEKSDYSDPVNVQSDTNFYAAKVVNNESVQFDIFKWHAGVWQKQSVTAGPGDVIGTAEAKPGGTNFVTGWTVVDIVNTTVSDARNRVVLLASDNGTLEREVKTDSRNKMYRNLNALVDKANGVVAPTGMPPGGPGAPPPPRMGANGRQGPQAPPLPGA